MWEDSKEGVGERSRILECCASSGGIGMFVEGLLCETFPEALTDFSADKAATSSD